MSRSPAWSMRDLQRLTDDLRAGYALTTCAIRQRGLVSAAKCDLAAWTKLGRPLGEALKLLNGQ